MGRLSPTAHFWLLVAVAVGLMVHLAWAVHRVVKTAHATGPATGPASIHFLQVHPDRAHWLLGGHRWLPFEDKSDFQWFGFRDQLPATLAIAVGHILAVHVIDIVSHRGRSVRAFFQATAGIAAVVYLHGTDSVVVLMCVLLFYLISQCTRSKCLRWLTPPLTWTTAVFILLVTSFHTHRASKVHHFVRHRLGWPEEVLDGARAGHADEEQNYPVTRSINLLILRLISFNLDRYWRSKQLASSASECCPLPPHNSNSNRPTSHLQQIKMEQIAMSRSRPTADYNLLFLMSYAFFMPLYVAGPIIAFNSFCHSLSVHTIARRKWLLRACLQWVAIFVVTELVFNRMLLISALGIEAANRHLWEHFSVIELVTMGGCVLFYTWAKFVMLWSGFRIWSILSGFYCPANLDTFLYDYYSAQSFWRDWHRSFHFWMVRYMYIPLGGGKRKVRATFLIFLFAALWHRVNLSFLAWAIITCFTILLELSLERHLGVSFVQKCFRDDGRKTQRILISGEILAALLIIANLVGFGPGYEGFLHFANLCIARPSEFASAALLFGFLGYLHVSYLIHRDRFLHC